ncbi:hypothetical protein GH714_002738 [Hevea brasiliensis]|uniref:U4/U6.U5 small nuclear ribonucleoprotein 27kDa protein domain-containing protein n=1 Tax=Hevea brasiliensis TaxID=3981 RepID=A0A6A6MAC4_HEVBR|nr:hypothetical protein GH714_002738 [Hevea brasiliensis]
MERIGNNNTSGDGGGEGGEGEVVVEGSLVDEDEIEMMKKLGIPIGFDSTKGKPVPGADVSGPKGLAGTARKLVDPLGMHLHLASSM